MWKKNRVVFLLICIPLIAVFISLQGCGREVEDTDSFNIVLIVIDTLRSDHLPFYDYENNTAPFLYELSKKSVIFQNAFSASSWTAPATASIFTSMYPFQHGVLMGWFATKKKKEADPNVVLNRIPEKISTLPEILKENGYATYAVAGNVNISKQMGFAQGFDKFKSYGHRDAATLNRVVRKWHHGITSDEKYFLYIHYMDPHYPYEPRKPWYKPQDSKKQNLVAAYDSEISYVDQHIKTLFKLFEWEDNTLIIVTSDHGEAFWEHGHTGHGISLYREELQVPFMVYMPGGTTHRYIQRNVCTIDILPTIRGFIGLPPGETDEGINLIPLIENRSDKLKNRTIYAYLKCPTAKEVEWESAIHKNWHFLFRKPNRKMLFSYLSDKTESLDKFRLYPDLAQSLDSRLNTFKRNCERVKQVKAKIRLNKKKLELLKTLGYVR